MVYVVLIHPLFDRITSRGSQSKWRSERVLAGPGREIGESLALRAKCAPGVGHTASARSVLIVVRVHRGQTAVVIQYIAATRRQANCRA